MRGDNITKCLGPIAPGREEFLATMIDTEGSVLVRRGANGGGTITFRAVVVVTNTSVALIEKTRSAVGFGDIQTRPGCNRPVLYYIATGPRAVVLLRAVYPFLVVKQRQALLALHLQDLIVACGGARGPYPRDPALTAVFERCHVAVKALNRGGDPDIGSLLLECSHLRESGPRHVGRRRVHTQPAPDATNISHHV